MKSIVVSDIHGDLNQLIYPLLLYLSNPNEYKLILLGDYIDRGESNVYIYELMRVIHNCKNVHALFGNHELYDMGTIDYVSYRSPNRVRSNSFIKTFVYDLFYNLDLDVVYYDKDVNILYSHSPLNRPLPVVLKLPKSVESTFTYDIGSANMKYKNIHGHDHKRSNKDDVHSFFTGTDVNMISIDRDSSYGMGLMQNAMTTNCYPCDWVNDTMSRVYYLIIDNEDIKNYKIVSKNIPYGSMDDYNHVSFVNIKQILIDACNDASLLKSLAKLSLNTSYEEFRKGFGNVTGFPKSLRDMYKKNMRDRCDGGKVNVYYHDLPFEFYQKIMEDGKKISNELKSIVMDHEWIPVHDLYWNYVISGSDERTSKNNNIKESMKGGYMDNMNVVMYMIISMIVVLAMIGIVLVVVYRNRIRDGLAANGGGDRGK